MWTKVCVVGGGGFIGSRLCQMQPDWESVDLKSDQDFCDMNVEIDANVVVLLAAHLGHTAGDYDKNLRIYSALVKRFKNRAVHVIYTSSAAVYSPSFRPTMELTVPKPDTIYGKSKLLGEQIIRDTMESYTILRLANVYGDGEGNGAIDLFKRGQKAIFGDGEQVRDYIYVEDVCKAIATVEDNLDSFAGMTINVSSGKGQTVNQVFEKYGKGKPKYIEPREFDIPFSILNNGVAKGLGLL